MFINLSCSLIRPARAGPGRVGRGAAADSSAACQIRLRRGRRCRAEALRGGPGEELRPVRARVQRAARSGSRTPGGRPSRAEPGRALPALFHAVRTQRLDELIRVPVAASAGRGTRSPPSCVLRTRSGASHRRPVMRGADVLPEPHTGSVPLVRRVVRVEHHERPPVEAAQGLADEVSHVRSCCRCSVSDVRYSKVIF